jgi:glutamine phosphoribosylpyrophosphate amidotransferase
MCRHAGRFRNHWIQRPIRYSTHLDWRTNRQRQVRLYGCQRERGSGMSQIQKTSRFKARSVLSIKQLLSSGEAVIIEKGKAPQFRQITIPRNYAPDLFEYVYFARPDSFLDGISVYRSRIDMGKYLAQSVKNAVAPQDVKSLIDVVIPVPDTSRESALELSNVLGLKYREGFVKNRYVGRTFIMPGQQDR